MLLKTIICAAALLTYADACTVIALGKKATVDGSVMVAHTDDNGGSPSDLRVIRVPAADHPPGSMRPVYRFSDPYPRVVAPERGPMYSPLPDQEPFKPDGFIPQVPHTYAYHDADYGMVNEVQLSIAETTTQSKFAAFRVGTTGGNSLFAIDELSRLALERCDSARCAVQTMGDAAVKYGFFGSSSTFEKPSLTSASETLAVGDKYGEVWVFHVLPGPNNASAVWAAQRVPDDHVAVVANGLTIRQMDLEDKDNFLASENVIQAAVDAGFFDPNAGKPFDFTAAYGTMGDTPAGVHTSALYIGRRMWRIYDMLAPSTKQDPYAGYHVSVETYPFSVKVDAPVSVRKVMEIMGDTYAGTEFDQSKGLGAGPWGYPARFGGNTNLTGGWERPISMFRTLWSFVIQSRPNMPDEIGGLVWFGPDAPIGSVWLPLYASSNNVAPTLSRWGKMAEADTGSLWWAFHFVNDWVARKYSLMVGDVNKMQAQFQDAAFEKSQEWEERALKICSPKSCDRHDARIARRYLERASAEFAEVVNEHWWKFAWRLIAKYQSAYIINGDTADGMVNHGYPVGWVNQTEFAQWPPTNTYTPPAGADPAWANIVKTREEAAKHALGNSGGFPWAISLLSFLLGALVSAVVYYFVVDKQKRHEYAPLQ